MNNKGMAISSILYTILVLFLVLIFGILGLISSAKTTFDTLKNKLSTDLNDTKPHVTAFEDEFVDNRIIVSVTSRKYISSYYISQSEDPVTKEDYSINYESSSIKESFSYPIGTFNIDYMKENNNQYYIYLKDIHDNVYKYPINIDQSSCNVPIGTAYNFEYTGSPQEFIAPCDGIYDVELWGAQGTDTIISVSQSSYKAFGGKGAYTSGRILLDNNTPLYIYVGKEGTANSAAYNGGGQAINGARNINVGGGGATDIRYFAGNTITNSDLNCNSIIGLNSRIMVAAGGGGATNYTSSASSTTATWEQASGGSGGGLDGYQGNNSINGNRENTLSYAMGGTQVGGGSGSTSNSSDVRPGGSGLFGIGGSALNNDTSAWGGSGSGGGGYYGGGGGGLVSGILGSGAGGSSFISGYSGCNAITESSTSNNIIHTNQPNHYSGKVFSDAVMIDGKGCNWSTGSAANCGTNQPQPDGTNATGHSGNGYARITLSSYDQSPLLNYNISSNDLDSKSRITVGVNETKTFNITVKSLNSETTNYELYYKTSNDNKGISVSSTNLVSGSIGSKKSKTAQITITNTGSVSTIVKFIVAGSTTDREPVIDGKKIKSLNDCEYAAGQSWEFDYTGNIQEFTSLCKGTYKLEVWGAQGGKSADNTENSRGGYGAYSVGNVALDSNDTLYIAVGGAGKTCTTYGSVASGQATCGNDGGYNGGGSTRQYTNTTLYGSGGGATHIATVSGTLSGITPSNLNKVLIVAGAGGGSSYYASYQAKGGNAGGISGMAGEVVKTDRQVTCTGGNQTSAGSGSDTSGQSFGHGGNLGSYVGPGGGSGLYGGGTSEVISCGGSSYIGNSKLTNKKMVCYNCTTSTNTNTYTESNTCTSATPTANCSKQGNGYARITYLGKSTETLAAKILINNPVVKTNPTLTTTATTSAESGLYSMNVNNGFSGSKGKTYYFRGIVNNNYVTFAGKTWRIVRINEDGTVRLILDEDMDANTYTMNNVYQGASQMYFSLTNNQGTPEHPNARYALKTWYDNNIGNNPSYDSKVTNSQFNYFCEEAKIVYSNTENLSSGTTFMRVLDNTYTPTFECNKDQNNHQYINTNIGLLTIDEMLLAGGHTSQANSSFYLSKPYLWWLMSPGGVTSDGIAVSWAMTSNGAISVTCVHRDYMKLRPVINLNYNVEVTGNGTSSNPYVVK